MTTKSLIWYLNYTLANQPCNAAMQHALHDVLRLLQQSNGDKAYMLLNLAVLRQRTAEYVNLSTDATRDLQAQAEIYNTAIAQLS